MDNTKLPIPKGSLTALSPGGNITVLAPAEGLDHDAQRRMAATVLADNVWQAEQMGFYTVTPPVLRMAGGEFCLNATRALAVLLAHQGALPPAAAPHTWQGQLFTSGLEQLVDVDVCRLPEVSPSPAHTPQPAHAPNGTPTARTGAAWGAHAVSYAPRPCYDAGVSFHCIMPPCEKRGEGCVLVRVPGISHLLLDAAIHPFPRQWALAAPGLRRQYGLEQEDASGLIWWHRENGQLRIDPVVTVRDPLTTFYESACGSGSLALAVWLWQQQPQTAPFVVLQPSGQPLRVRVGMRDAQSNEVHLHVQGPVEILGTADAPL